MKDPGTVRGTVGQKPGDDGADWSTAPCLQIDRRYLRDTNRLDGRVSVVTASTADGHQTP